MKNVARFKAGGEESVGWGLVQCTRSDVKFKASGDKGTFS